MNTKCTNPKCGYEWDYKGNGMFYATCPQCLYKVSLKDQRNREREDILADAAGLGR